MIDKQTFLEYFINFGRNDLSLLTNVGNLSNAWPVDLTPNTRIMTVVSAATV